MELNVSVVDLSANQKKIQVEIPAERVREELEGKYRTLAKQARIKGFRPGKIPRSILKSYYGKTVEHEISSQFIQETYPDALRETALKPLAEADVSETRFEDNGTFTYVAIVDVCPAFQMEGYQGLKVTRPQAQVQPEQEQAELERLRQQHAQVRTLEEQRPVMEGDLALVDFTPWVGDEVYEKGKASNQMLEVGKNTVHPGFDSHLVGHSAGESLSFTLEYPEDSVQKEIAGKQVRFEVEIREIKEKVLPELNDEFAKELGQFETLADLKQFVSDQLRKQAEDQVRTAINTQIMNQLIEKTPIELTDKVVQREVDNLIQALLQQFESQGLKLDPSRFNTPEIRADYRPQAVRNLQTRLILEQIAKQEGIQLTEEETEEIYQQVARFARMDVEQVKEQFADSAIVGQAQETKIQEKVFRFLEEAAVAEEPTEVPGGPAAPQE